MMALRSGNIERRLFLEVRASWNGSLLRRLVKRVPHSFCSVNLEKGGSNSCLWGHSSNLCFILAFKNIFCLFQWAISSYSASFYSHSLCFSLALYMLLVLLFIPLPVIDPVVLIDSSSSTEMVCIHNAFRGLLRVSKTIIIILCI